MNKFALITGIITLAILPQNAAATSRGQICGYRCKITVTCADGSVHSPVVAGCGFTEFEVQNRLFEVAEQQTCAAHGGWKTMHSLYCEHMRTPRTDWPNAAAAETESELDSAAEFDSSLQSSDLQ